MVWRAEAREGVDRFHSQYKGTTTTTADLHNVAPIDRKANVHPGAERRAPKIGGVQPADALVALEILKAKVGTTARVGNQNVIVCIATAKVLIAMSAVRRNWEDIRSGKKIDGPI